MGVAIVLAIIIIFFFSNRISKVSNSLAEKKKISFILEKRNSNLEKIKEGFSALEESAFDGKNIIEEALPPINNILGFTSALKDLASQNSLQQSLKFSSPIPLQEVGKINIYSIDYAITLNGGISSLINYLKSFEKMPYFSGISEITLNAPPTGWESNSSILMKAKLYAQ